MISVKILADSLNPAGIRITSWLLTYPRFIHSEFMTHRIFSRNAASSRAIPFKKMVESLKVLAAMPERWGSEQKGMQSGSEVSNTCLVSGIWCDAMYNAIGAAEACATHGLHKSLCNRLIEPFSHITVLATATDHRNFFALRAHPDAMPEFQVLAYRMLDQYLKNEPQEVQWGNWHIPKFDHAEQKESYDKAANAGGEWQKVALKIATARCARLSYLTFDGDHDPAKDIELHDRLLASGHMSPFEHCAQAVNSVDYPWSNFDSLVGPVDTGGGSVAIGGLSGWMQYRKRFENENRTDVDLAATLATKPDWITL